MPGPSLRSWHLGALIFCALITTVSAQVSWFDAGEFSAASAGLGVPHPTGFPLLCVLAYAAQLFPLGPVPFKLGLLCALCVAATSGLIHATALRLGARPYAALFGALFYPSVGVVWLHGGVLEVYALNGLMLSLLGWLLLAPEPRWRCAAFITGLGLGAHVTFPLLALVLWVMTLTQHKAWGRVIRWVPLGLFGALLLLYLPVAASRDPWLNWGDPSSFEALWAHLSASGIRDAFADEMGAQGAETWHALSLWLDNAAGPLWPALLVVMLLGGVLGARRWVWSIALIAAMADAAFSVLMNPMGQGDLQTGMPGSWALSLALALGGANLDLRGLLSRTHGVLLALLVGASGLMLWMAPAQEDLLASRYGQSALMEPGPNAVVLLSSDHLAGQFLYLQGIEGMRPDVVTLVIQHLAERGDVHHRYAHSGQVVPPAFRAIEARKQSDALMALARSEVKRTSLYWELGDGRFDAHVARVLRPGRVLYRVAENQERADAALGPLRAPGSAILEGLAPRGELATRSKRVMSDLSRLRGVWHLIRAELDAGVAALEDAVRLDDENPQALLNLAAARRRQGRHDEAIALLERCLELTPTYEKARQNLALYRAEAGP